MKKKLFLLGMFGMALAFGIAFVGCNDKSDDDENGGNTDPKKITITGITEHTGQASVSLLSGEGDTIAEGVDTIASNSLTVSLKKDSADWTGTGSYFMMLVVDETEQYVYTDGKTLEELGISSEEDFGKLPKVTISETTTTVAFTKFKSVSDE